jgi:hypothetical protein
MTERLSEDDDRLFTDSFAPHEKPDSDPLTDDTPEGEEDELDKIEDLLPKSEPTDGPAPLP